MLTILLRICRQYLYFLYCLYSVNYAVPIFLIYET